MISQLKWQRNTLETNSFYSFLTVDVKQIYLEKNVEKRIIFDGGNFKHLKNE
jgi:hypothetical protein